MSSRKGQLLRRAGRASLPSPAAYTSARPSLPFPAGPRIVGRFLKRDWPRSTGPDPVAGARRRRPSGRTAGYSQSCRHKIEPAVVGSGCRSVIGRQPVSRVAVIAQADPRCQPNRKLSMPGRRSFPPDIAVPGRPRARGARVHAAKSEWSSCRLTCADHEHVRPVPVQVFGLFFEAYYPPPLQPGRICVSVSRSRRTRTLTVAQKRTLMDLPLGGERRGAAR